MPPIMPPATPPTVPYSPGCQHSRSVEWVPSVRPVASAELALERARQVVDPAAGEVVDGVHLGARGDQRVDDMGADEAGAAGDEDLHVAT